MSTAVIMHLDHLQGRIDYPNDVAPAGQILMNLLESILGKIGGGYNLHRQGRRTLNWRTFDIDPVKMCHGEEGNIRPTNHLAIQERVGFAADVSELINPPETP